MVLVPPVKRRSDGTYFHWSVGLVLCAVVVIPLYIFLIWLVGTMA